MNNKIKTNSTNITFQEYQAIYSELTKKTEKINKYYSNSFKLNKQMISHLKSLIDDTLRQYNIVSINNNITVFQADKTQKIYSSIDNFLNIETTSKETEQIIIEYDILINVPNIEKKQNYKIVISIVSDLIAFEKIRNDIPIEILNMIEKNNISIKIDFVDYTIAKSILNIIDEWTHDISENENKFLTIIEKQKNFISLTIKTLIVFFSFLMIFNYIPLYIDKENTDMQILTKFFIISYALVYFTHKVGLVFSKLIQSNLSYLQNISAISFTEQDKKLIKEYEKKKKSRISSFIITIILTIIYGTISSVIASKYFI